MGTTADSVSGHVGAELSWIVVAGLAMSALALVGGAALLLPQRLFSRVVMPLVALAAGNFIFIVVADLLSEITTSPVPQ